MYTIELGCPPGSPRPGDLLPEVLKGTGVTINPEKTAARLFGDWEWIVRLSVTDTSGFACKIGPLRITVSLVSVR